MRKLTNKKSKAQIHIVIAIAFAAAMLIISYIIRGHEQANTVVLIMIALYVTISNLAIQVFANDGNKVQQ